jgi:opacity protein-like surface antigen
MLYRIVVTGCFAACAVNAVAAQGLAGTDFSPRRLQIGIGGGAVVPRTNARYQDVLTGATGQAYLLLRIAPGFPALRIGADFSRMKFGAAQSGFNQQALGTTRTQLGGIASLRFDLLPGPVRPYVLAGVGGFNIRDAIDSTGKANAATFSTNQIGVDGGAGLSFRMGRISGFLETRIQNVYTKAQGLIDTKSIQAFPITFGLIF